MGIDASRKFVWSSSKKILRHCPEMTFAMCTAPARFSFLVQRLKREPCCSNTEATHPAAFAVWCRCSPALVVVLIHHRSPTRGPGKAMVHTTPTLVVHTRRKARKPCPRMAPPTGQQLQPSPSQSLECFCALVAGCSHRRMEKAQAWQTPIQIQCQAWLSLARSAAQPSHTHSSIIDCVGDFAAATVRMTAAWPIGACPSAVELLNERRRDTEAGGKVETDVAAAPSGRSIFCSHATLNR
jgi:hypothetical protein